MSVTLRAATADDAERVALLSHEFVAYLRSLGDQGTYGFTAEVYLRDGFGQNPAFSGLVAELDGEMVGYLLYCPGYDLDHGGRIIHIVDLFVHETARHQGVARALMEAVADICRLSGGKQLLWAVYTPNTLAKEFYERLGATYVRDLQYMRLPV
jgi:GNAT superfamily N-acetyltransferase